MTSSRTDGRDFRVFISSTFVDMQPEREHLVSHVFPELRQLCRERGVAFTEIDLRWGITERQARRRKIVSTCLDEIHHQEPFIIALVGDRYGWVPGREDLGTDPALLERYRWLLPAVDAGRSLVELETLESVQHNPSLRDHIQFYFRSAPGGTGRDTDESRLQGLKGRVRMSGLPIREAYRDVERLGAWVREDLLAEIERRYPLEQVPTFIEMERRGHEAFAASRRRGYVEHRATIEKLDEFVVAGGSSRFETGARQPSADFPSATADESLPLVVAGASGSGKSSLLSYWSAQYRCQHPEAFIITHHIGATPTSTSHLGLLRRIMLEIQERYGLTTEVPTSAEAIATEFPSWLGYVRQESRSRNSEISPATSSRLPGLVLVIDALNQLSESSRRSLRWLPDLFPPYVRVIISTLDGDILTELQRRGWPILTVQPLGRQERAAIVKRYLSTFGKQLDTANTRRLVRDPKSVSPLFLVATMEEVRVSATHENLDSRIQYLLDASDLHDLYQRVLARMEAEHGRTLVRSVLSLIHASRNGLSKQELLELTGCSPRKLEGLLHGLGDNLLLREGLLGFFHDYLRQGVQRRYLATAGAEQKAHLRLATYFERTEESERCARELLWQYSEAAQPGYLRELLGRIPMLRALYHGSTRFEVLAAWKQLVDGGADPEETYRVGVERFKNEGSHDEVIDGLDKAADLLLVLGRWRMALEFYDEFARLAEEIGTTERLAEAECSIGLALSGRGRFDEALPILEHALAQFEELGDRMGIARAIGNIGIVYWGRDDRDGNDREKALACFQRQRAICEEIGDRAGVATALAGMGRITAKRGDVDGAMVFFQQRLEMLEDLGNRNAIADVLNSMGNVLTFRDGDRSLEYCRRSLSIFQELGDRSGTAVALANMAMVYHLRRDYDRAFECYQREMSILEELDLPENLASVASSMGFIHISRGEIEQGLRCFQRVVSLWEREGNDMPIRLMIVIVRVGLGYVACRENARGLQCFNIARERYGPTTEYRLESAFCSSGVAKVLLESAGLDGPMPEFLSGEIREEGSTAWQHLALERARTLTEESIITFQQLADSYGLIDSQILLAMIEAALGDRSAAAVRLTGLLSEEPIDEQRAEIHYRLWKNSVDAGDEDSQSEAHRSVALQVYEALIADAPEHEYTLRVAELTAVTVPDAINV